MSLSRRTTFEDEETSDLAQAIEASLRDELSLKARRMAEEILQQHADEQLAQALDGLHEQDEAIQATVTNEALLQTLEDSQRRRSEERHQDRWDCVQCTYTNDPYCQTCVMCHAKPPAHVLVYRKIPDHTQFGVELEIVMPFGKRDGFTLESVAQQLTNLGPYTVQYRGYTHETTSYWKIVTDNSLQGGHSQDLCFELVSPVLKGEDGLASLRTIMEHTRRLGIATNKTCSFHVHVDATQKSLFELQRLAQAAISLENAFDLLVSLSWNASRTTHTRRANRNQYCQSNRLLFGERSNRQRWDSIANTNTMVELVDKINPNRYYKLNMSNITNSSRPSTVEFRHFGGVEDIRQAEAWVRLVLIFCHEASSASGMVLQECTSPVTLELKALFDLVKCPGLEQFFTMDRKLFVNHRLRNDWSCNVCRRSFSTSRQLAQHVAACGHH